MSIGQLHYRETFPLKHLISLTKGQTLNTQQADYYPLQTIPEITGVTATFSDGTYLLTSDLITDGETISYTDIKSRGKKCANGFDDLLHNKSFKVSNDTDSKANFLCNTFNEDGEMIFNLHGIELETKNDLYTSPCNTQGITAKFEDGIYYLTIKRIADGETILYTDIKNRGKKQ